MTRVVVIGRSGQVATELRHTSLPRGWSLVSLGRDDLDLTKLERVKPTLAALEPDIIINAAAYTVVDRAEAEEDLATLVNGEAPGEMGRVAAGLGIPFISISTDYVFDGKSQNLWTEDDEPRPVNAYGRSKLAGERAVLNSAACAVILRTSWVFSGHGSNFVRTMLRLGKERDKLSIVADQWGGPTPADAIATALLKIGVKLVETSQGVGIYHFSGSPPTSWAGFAQIIFDGADWLPRKPIIKEITTAEYPIPAERPRNSILDCSKIKRDYDIDQPDWRAALAKTLNELRRDNTKKIAS